MDLLNKSSKYSSYLQRIQEYKEIADNNQAFAEIEGRVDNLYNELKAGSQKNFYNTIFRVILFVGLTTAFTCFFTGAYSLGVVNLLSVFAAYFYYKQSVKQYVEDSKREKSLVIDSSTFDSKLFHTMRYLENGIDLKEARIIAVRFIFMGLFSVIMFTSLSIMNIEHSTSKVVLYALSLCLNVPFWFYFFKDDLEELEYIAMELDEYIESYKESEKLSRQNTKANVQATIKVEEEKPIDFYNLDHDEPIELVANPQTEEDQEQKKYKQLKLEL